MSPESSKEGIGIPRVSLYIYIYRERERDAHAPLNLTTETLNSKRLTPYPTPQTHSKPSTLNRGP